jgi:hypothetical protein
MSMLFCKTEIFEAETGCDAVRLMPLCGAAELQTAHDGGELIEIRGKICREKSRAGCAIAARSQFVIAGAIAAVRERVAAPAADDPDLSWPHGRSTPSSKDIKAARCYIPESQ